MLMQKRISRGQVENLLRTLDDDVEEYKLVIRTFKKSATIRYAYSVCVYDKSGHLIRTVCNDTTLKKIYEYITNNYK